MTNESTIILASQSPRRKELLASLGIPFTCVVSRFEERLDHSRDADQVARALAEGKADAVAKQYPDAYVIGSDTVPAVNGRQLDKPADEADARAMLTSLAGTRSTVSTGLAIIHASKKIRVTDVSTTTVVFKPESEQIRLLREAYIATSDWRDKAGGYGIQSGASCLIDHIEGDFDTVVGLPLDIVKRRLRELGLLPS